MIDERMEEQVGMFDQDSWCGRMSAVPSVPTAAKTSKPSSQRSSASQSRTPLLCLSLKRVNGNTPEASMEWEKTDFPFPWLGVFMTLNGGACLNEEKGFVSYVISAGTQLPKFSLTLNIGEKPREEQPTRLSDILEDSPDPKYSLSQRACVGILNRANNRGKALPAELKEALERQAYGNNELHPED